MKPILAGARSKNKLLLFSFLLFLASKSFSQINIITPDSLFNSVRNQLNLILDTSNANLSSRICVYKFPIQIECYRQKTRPIGGVNLNQEDYLGASDSIYGIEFIEEVKSLLSDSIKLYRSFQFQDGMWFLLVNVNYELIESDGFNDEFSRVFRFIWCEDRLKLFMVFCAG